METTNTISNRLKSVMLDQGYIHESDIEELTGTVEASRKRWKHLPVVMFGRKRYYSLDGIKAHLDSKVSTVNECEVVSLT